MRELLESLPGLTLAHLRLSLTALALGTAISLPLGVWAHRQDKLRGLLLGGVGILQTIPSLALLAFMVPAIGALAPLIEASTGVRPSAIGEGPALMALTVYGLLPVLQNTVAGLAGVDPAAVEAARGVGMTDRQRLLQVELPLALPVIVAGLRTSAVWTVGTAVLATPIGAASLGAFIFVGLQTRNHASIAVGCAASALLALGLDAWIRGFQGALERRARGTMRVMAALSVSVWLAVLAPVVWPSGSDGRPKVRVGAKAFTEGYLFAEIFGARLAEAGFEVDQIGSLGSTVIFDALVSGDVDVYLDFSGTILANVMKEEVGPGGREGVLERIRTWLDKTHDIRVAAVLGYENRYAFALRKAQAESLGVRTLSDLAEREGGLSLVASYEFFDRPEWASVQASYAFDFAERTIMEQALAYDAVHSGARDVVVAYSTDARIVTFDLAVLDDDKGAIPPYEAIALVRGAFADAHPKALEALAPLAGAFDEPAVRRLNRAVDEEGTSPAQAAHDWLRSFDAERD
ncbi:MAG: ABC transporter permease/substrate-binding protein [Myxococcota bacterium]